MNCLGNVVNVVRRQRYHGDTSIFSQVDSMLTLQLLHLVFTQSTVAEHPNLLLNEGPVTGRSCMSVETVTEEHYNLIKVLVRTAYYIKISNNCIYVYSNHGRCLSMSFLINDTIRQIKAPSTFYLMCIL